MTRQWQCALSLDAKRRPDSGSADNLSRMIRAGADLRVGTAFRHNEHIEPSSDSDELIREVMDFRITYLIKDRWVAGIENLRMPIALPDGFGPRESMSFFLYNTERAAGDCPAAPGRRFCNGLRVPRRPRCLQICPSTTHRIAGMGGPMRRAAISYTIWMCTASAWGTRGRRRFRTALTGPFTQGL